jgi:hypothetical protein
MPYIKGSDQSVATLPQSGRRRSAPPAVRRGLAMAGDDDFADGGGGLGIDGLGEGDAGDAGGQPDDVQSTHRNVRSGRKACQEAQVRLPARLLLCGAGGPRTRAPRAVSGWRGPARRRFERLAPETPRSPPLSTPWPRKVHGYARGTGGRPPGAASRGVASHHSPQ